MDFDNPKVYGDTFISDGLVCPKTLKASDAGQKMHYCSYYTELNVQLVQKQRAIIKYAKNIFALAEKLTTPTSLAKSQLDQPGTER